MSKYSNFKKTNLYNNYYSNNQEILLEHTDFYHNTLQELLLSFKCKYLPTDDNVLDYIEEHECIDDKDIDDFKLFVSYIFGKYYDIKSQLKDLQKKYNRKQKALDKIECICGKIYTRKHKARHEESEVHTTVVAFMVKHNITI